MQLIRCGERVIYTAGYFLIFSIKTLKILYSENVGTPTIVYDYLDKSTDLPFNATLTASSEVTPSEKIFNVENISIEYIVSGDSIRILDTNGEGLVSDALNNHQHQSVFAPIVVENAYAIDLELKIFPQPLVLVAEESGATSPTQLDEKMVAHYNIQNNFADLNGMAFIIEANGPIALNAASGKAQILDQLGNAVSDEITMIFDAKEGGNIAGVAIWDGKNQSGRTVGRGSYLLALEVSVETDEGDKSRTIERSYIKTLGVFLK